VFDVGAFKGEFAELVHVIFPAARVWCFEPFTDSYERIRSRFAGAPWVSVHNFALSDHSGTAELIIGEDQSTNSILSPVMKDGVFDTDRPRVSVRLETLSASAGQMLPADPQISILKVDTEGNDLAVLEGGEDLLRRGRIEAVHVEVMFMEHFKGAAGFVEIAQYLQQFGYRLYSLYDLKKNRQGQLRYGNALFLSPHRQTFAGIAR
jgi:FkbM family methyltransferase